MRCSRVRRRGNPHTLPQLGRAPSRPWHAPALSLPPSLPHLRPPAPRTPGSAAAPARPAGSRRPSAPGLRTPTAAAAPGPRAGLGERETERGSGVVGQLLGADTDSCSCSGAVLGRERQRETVRGAGTAPAAPGPGLYWERERDTVRGAGTAPECGHRQLQLLRGRGLCLGRETQMVRGPGTAPGRKAAVGPRLPLSLSPLMDF